MNLPRRLQQSGRTIFLASTLLLILSAAGPKVGPRVIVTQPDESRFPTITVYFEVKRPDGSYLLDAVRRDFAVSEGGQDRPILRFEAPEATELRPTTVVLVVDHSGSMGLEGRIEALKRAVATFLEGLPPTSRVAVIAFGSEVELICEFTTDRLKVLEAVNELQPVGATRFYDAVSAALDILENETGRRAVLALTDGKDEGSRRMNLRGVIAQARKLNLPVHTLGLGDEGLIAVEELSQIAETTRGQHYLARDVEQLQAIYQEIARRIGSTYSLTYDSDRRIQDGTLRPIRITYQQGGQGGETSVFIPGMVIPEAGWSRLFLGLTLFLVILACLPFWLRYRTQRADPLAKP